MVYIQTNQRICIDSHFSKLHMSAAYAMGLGGFFIFLWSFILGFITLAFHSCPWTLSCDQFQTMNSQQGWYRQRTWTRLLYFHYLSCSYVSHISKPWLGLLKEEVCSVIPTHPSQRLTYLRASGKLGKVIDSSPQASSLKPAQISRPTQWKQRIVRNLLSSASWEVLRLFSMFHSCSTILDTWTEMRSVGILQTLSWI